MSIPTIGVFFASIFVWAIANVFTLGLAGFISTPVTAAFIALLGMRAALEINGKDTRGDLKSLALSAVVFGVVLMIGKAAVVLLTDVSAILITDWKLGEIVSIRSLANAERAVQMVFVLHAFSVKAILSVVLLAAVPAVMAIPMAAAARKSGNGIADGGVFYGFGRRFLPLYLICLVTYVPQFVLGIIGSLFAFVAALVALAGILNGSVNLNVDGMWVLLQGFGALAALLWLNSWVWAASALAFLSYEKDEPQKPLRTPVQAEVETVDLRALRKKRSNT